MIGYLKGLYAIESSPDSIEVILTKAQGRLNETIMSPKEEMCVKLLLGEYIRKSIYIKEMWMILAFTDIRLQITLN